jgi:mono/diheme cytochrome c family protein
MVDGFRRLTIVFALISFLIPSAMLLAGTGPEWNAPTVIAQNSSDGSARSAKAVEAKAAITPKDQAEAAHIFQSRCAACHGAEGRGDGPAASNMDPRPRDFQNPKWQKSITDATIAQAIVHGGAAVGVSGEMAPNPDLGDEPGVVAALVEHVRGLGK